MNHIPLGPGVVMVARDRNGLVAFNKPAGVLSHPNEAGDERRSLVNAAYDEATECYSWGVAAAGIKERSGGSVPGGRLWLLNRLDSATSGVILAAEDSRLAREIKDQFRHKQVHKIYSALVFGAPRKTPDTWRDVVEVVKRGGQIRTGAGRGGTPAECKMSLERRTEGEAAVSLLRLEPRTGRSHQLRVQCAKRGLPIVGDQTYGDFKANREFSRRTKERRLFLHSIETSFSYTFNGVDFAFTAAAALPDSFARVMAEGVLPS